MVGLRALAYSPPEGAPSVTSKDGGPSRGRTNQSVEVEGRPVASVPTQLAAELEARRSGRPVVTVVRGRGALVRRALVTADAVALFLAFLITALAFGPGEGVHNHLALGAEYLLFLLSLPLCALGAKL